VNYENGLGVFVMPVGHFKSCWCFYSSNSL